MNSGSRPSPSQPPLGALLREEGLLSLPALQRALETQKMTGERLGELLVRLELVAEEEVARALARRLALPYAAPPLSPEPAARSLIPAEVARRRRVLPLAFDGRAVRVAMGDPLDLATQDEIQFLTGRRVVAVLASPSSLRRGLREAYPAEVSEPVARLVEALLLRAVEGGASDLHVEQGDTEVVVRERVDGVLRHVAGVPPAVRASLLSRIKVLAEMDISVRRRPQDGGFVLRHDGRTIPVRVSTLPVEGGEKAVLRLLDPSAVPRGLEDLGLAPRDLDRLREMIRGGRGVILTAGPTGSGKSSTLFGVLAEVDRDALNVVTLEDPIEYRVGGVNQVQVAPRAGLTFPSALRSVLRQDPDVLMVGEIRDGETAEIAMSAAVTGHLVLSTIHTTDSAGGITRLLHMGVPPHLVAAGLSGIVAQRLVRRVCTGCGGRSEGCHRCHRGYRGRTGIFEVLVMDEALREDVIARAGTEVFRRRARAAGMGSMAADARRKVAEGLTTPHEVARVLHPDAGRARGCVGCGGDLPYGARGCPRCGRPAGDRCACGTVLLEEWKFCPECLEPRPGP